MKKLVLAVSLGLMTGSLYAACLGPYCYDDSGNATLTGALVIPTVAVTSVTPNVTGLIVKDSSNNVYISTATATPSSWMKIGAQ